MNRRTLNIMAGALVVIGAGLYAGCQRSYPGGRLQDEIADLTPRQTIGQQVYMRHCNQCHPGGGAGLGPSINSKPLPSFAIKAQVRNGGGAMPPFDEPKISDQNLTAIVDYLDRLRGKTRPW